ncbi:hypothetical protein IP68_08550 [Blastomonas sp. AAP25]|uniref:hypothetical protein n=1 Tax=Blastomonas sp. AAP25 TaxID=1523416 RepID=UPI0006B99D96|nr:hypothetical protein [Blastomonas sp. AAP25]KPF75306.1 hypothetical protein IP68_08550 [Blastomonas sp. AAP25]
MTNIVVRIQEDEIEMSNILTSDLFRNFMGGFALGAVALFALQPRDADASPPAAPVVQEAAMENPDS